MQSGVAGFGKTLDEALRDFETPPWEHLRPETRGFPIRQDNDAKDTGTTPVLRADGVQGGGRIPEGDLWQYELKLDGYRTIAAKEDGEVRLYSRNGNSFNSEFPVVARLLENLRPKRFIVDGEIVALDENGRHSFALLQKIKTSKAPLRFYIFDLLHFDGENLMP